MIFLYENEYTEAEKKKAFKTSMGTEPLSHV